MEPGQDLRRESAALPPGPGSLVPKLSGGDTGEGELGGRRHDGGVEGEGERRMYIHWRVGAGPSRELCGREGEHWHRRSTEGER